MAKKEKKKKGGLLKEFKEFAIKGNMFDMAIGVLIGGIFKDLVTAFTNNIIMPIVNVFTGSIDFSKWKIALPSLFGAKLDPETGEEIINYLTLGDFISAVISFLILAFVVFLMVKGVNKLRTMGKKEEEEAPAAPPEPSNEEKLLTEIRDLLKDK
ncbi:MAG: large-conductance mechanosensitive channel protein MscL [Oscillospiraceae bacterium]|nr:large-conductance mechanosensitive channel protein MscL [Oscillospiraceae bacterium]